MEPDRTIPVQDWMIAPETAAVMRALGGEIGGGPQALFVGGCVRNTLLGRPVDDIDIATVWKPEEATVRLEAAGIKVVPTGIEHGTVTAVVEGRPFEITTLRRDVETFGRHAVVAYTADWREDAQRRDFTMNTLLADPAGHVFDPTGQGLADLEARRVRFVGDPATRIAEDYLRILRLFRFHAYYGEGPLDRAALAACYEAAAHIADLSRERITREFLKILMVGNPVDILGIMFDNNIIRDIHHPDCQAGAMEKLCGLQKQYGRLDPVARLAVLSGFDAGNLERLEKYLVLSNAQRKAFVTVLGIQENESDVKRLIYRHGPDMTAQALFLGAARRGTEGGLADAMDVVEHWTPPAFPLTGADVMAAGVPEGPRVGEILAAVEGWWIAQDFAPDAAVCRETMIDII